MLPGFESSIVNWFSVGVGSTDDRAVALVNERTNWRIVVSVNPSPAVTVDSPRAGFSNTCNGVPADPSPDSDVSCSTAPAAAVVGARAVHLEVAESQPNTCPFVGAGAFTSGRSSSFAVEAYFTSSRYSVFAPTTTGVMFTSNVELSTGVSTFEAVIRNGSAGVPDPVMEMPDPAANLQAQEAPPQQFGIYLTSPLRSSACRCWWCRQRSGSPSGRTRWRSRSAPTPPSSSASRPPDRPPPTGPW